MDKIIQALIRSAAFGFIGIAMGAPASRIADAAEYTLMPSPRTVNIGNFDAANKPVLTVNSGDIVTLEAATQIEPEAVDASGAVPRTAVPQYVVRSLFVQIRFGSCLNLVLRTRGNATRPRSVCAECYNT